MQSILSVASTRKTKLLDIADRNLKRYSYFGKQPSTLNINIHTQCLTQQLHSWPCSQRNEHLYIFTKNIYILSPYYRSVLLQALTGADYDERMFFFLQPLFTVQPVYIFPMMLFTVRKDKYVRHVINTVPHKQFWQDFIPF